MSVERVSREKYSHRNEPDGVFKIGQNSQVDADLAKVGSKSKRQPAPDALMAPTRPGDVARVREARKLRRRMRKRPVLTLEKSSTRRDGLDTTSPCAQDRAGDRRLAGLTVAAIGVVYGDIGTSPLYTMREAFGAHGGLPLGEAAVLGVLSLIFWALLLVVTIKYVTVIMRADNQGEGGVLALARLVLRSAARRDAGSAWRSCSR